MHKFKILAELSVVFTCALLTACGGVLASGKPARQVYMLQSPPVTASADTGAPEGGALVLAVHAVPGLDTDQIQVLGTDARLLPAANARWADNLPEVFTSIARHYLSDTRQFKAVHVGSLARPDEWLVELELQAFYGIQGAGGATSGVELTMEVMLHCDEKQNVVRVTQRTGTSGDTLSSLVAAHQQVLDAAMQELPGLILKSCRA